MLSKSKLMILDICKKNNIECKFLSKEWIIMLKKDNKTRFIAGYKFSLNDHALGEVLDDKYALYDVLRENKIDVVEHNILYPSTNLNDYALDANNTDIVKEYLKKYKSIVIKPCKGTCGNDVYHINDINEIDEVTEKLFNKYVSISYSPYYDIKNEYRLITLNGNIELIYKKKRPIVTGNGKDTIKELLLNFNYEYFKDKLDDEIYNKVLDNNEVFEYTWKFNLSNGSIATFDIDDDIKNKLITLATKAINTLNIKFASIDIVEEENNFLILEINSGVMVENLINIVDDISIVENIYTKAILSMFKE